MDFSLALLLAAFAGGLFGAAIGALPAFVFTGFAVILGVAAQVGGAEADILTNVAFGPVFGPHIAFAGGVAASAFAARKGSLENGRDIAAPMAGLNDPSLLLVGGVFGAGGYLVNQALLAIPTFSGGVVFTDTVALTVAISAIVVRLIFGNTGLFGSMSTEARSRGRFVPGGDQVWVAYQHSFAQASVIGLGAGLLGGFLVALFAGANPDYGPIAVVLGFGLSAASLLFLELGLEVPVTHHMTLPGSVAALAVFTGTGGSPLAAVIVGGIAGVAGALLGEFFSRLFLIHGDTHVDPPANAIWVMATVVVIFGLIL